MALFTSAMFTFRLRNWSGFTATVIWRSVPPTISTSPTPITVCRRFFKVLSVQSVNSRRLTLSVPMAMLSMDSSIGLNSDTTGVSMSRSNVPPTAPTLSRTSCTDLAVSTSNSNSAITTDEPSNEYERMFLMPLMVFSASSIGLDTSLSTTSGEAPS